MQQCNSLSLYQTRFLSLSVSLCVAVVAAATTQFVAVAAMGMQTTQTHHIHLSIQYLAMVQSDAMEYSRTASRNNEIAPSKTINQIDDSLNEKMRTYNNHHYFVLFFSHSIVHFFCCCCGCPSNMTARCTCTSIYGGMQIGEKGTMNCIAY